MSKKQMRWDVYAANGRKPFATDSEALMQHSELLIGPIIKKTIGNEPNVELEIEHHKPQRVTEGTVQIFIYIRHRMGIGDSL